MIILWKILWQIVLVVTLISFVFMFIVFSYKGFKDLRKMLEGESE